jgi:uncharacterized protein (DUF1697 family)
MTHIAVLRAVNLPGHNKVRMADLKALFVRLGFADAQTLLQSGNVVFSAGNKTTAALEQMLERAAAKELGVETDFFVRTAKEWQAIIDANPFPREAKADPSHLLVGISRDEVSSANVTALQKAIVGRELVRAKGRCVYIVYPDGIGRSKLTGAMIDKKLGTRGTARNWNTVLKLAALCQTSSAT